MLKKKVIQSIDKRRNLIIAGNKEQTIEFALQNFIETLQNSIQKKNRFSVALSGGSTPKVMFEKLCSTYKDTIDWSKIWLYWGDERPVPPTDPDSNYHMAMEAGFSKVPIPKSQIFRMEAEKNISEKATAYEEILKKNLGKDHFDLVMLGMGEDGHTASLFPETKALDPSHAKEKWVLANFVPQKNIWRMTLSLKCINQSSKICFYVMGKGKQEMLKKVLSDHTPPFPSQLIGTENHKALWIADDLAAGTLFENP